MQTEQTTTERMGVDPLDVMKRAARRYAVGSRAGQEMRDAIAAVAELVAADREYDAARSVVEQTPLVGFGYRHLRERLDRARDRRRAALAPFSEAGR